VPVAPITALILATVGIPVIHHGGDRMPTKYGIPLIDLWQGLGLPFSQLSLAQNQALLQKSGLAFVYLPHHFKLALPLVDYRDQLGKRPPIASAELIWTPYQGNTHLIAGYVHPPSEERFQETLTLRNQIHLTTIKGLEGSCDLPLSRTTIIGTGQGNLLENWERILIHPAQYQLGTHDLAIESFEQCLTEIKAAIAGKATAIWDGVLLNGGFYLWHCGVAANLAAGLTLAEQLLTQGQVAQKLAEIRKNAIAQLNVHETAEI
jgi:anthranilate phosphoribosyltransferase